MRKDDRPSRDPMAHVGAPACLFGEHQHLREGDRVLQLGSELSDS